MHEASWKLDISFFVLRSSVKRLIQKIFQDSVQGGIAVAGVFFSPFFFYNSAHFEREDFSLSFVVFCLRLGG